jgi:hypothetical protein
VQNPKPFRNKCRRRNDAGLSREGSDRDKQIAALG